MLTFPIFSDQVTNSKMVVEDWGFGMRVKKEDDSLVKGDEIAELLLRVMDSESSEAKERRRRAKEMQEICKSASGLGGSSHVDLLAFIKDIQPSGMLKSSLRPRLAPVQFMLSLSSRDDPPSPSLLLPLCRLHRGATPSGTKRGLSSISMFLFGFLNFTVHLVAAFIDNAAADGAKAIEVGVVEGGGRGGSGDGWWIGRHWSLEREWWEMGNQER
ncbi:hypothetical protein SASPL_109313 [Salvia splendens]|uniref:Uncharacterized protein n=1 Tax=Salvia splendens TaxID=180675 RepID=A0A8X8YDZ3_SALSN|nr:hypothetical protein SASPL_109313 [Salvia splendens]